MKIALASARIVNRDMNYNLAQIKRYMSEAKARGAELVCFGEAFLQGFNALTWKFEEDQKIAITVHSEEFAQVKALSEKLGIDVLFGYNELDRAKIYSSCALVADGKIVHNYRRISKGWKEYSITDEHYMEGTTVDCFDYKGKKCVIGLCGDLWDYPERFALGEDLLLWPVYVCWTKKEWEKGGKKEYAEQAELCCPNTLYINSICDGDAFGGAAQFFDGNIQRELPILNEGLLYVEI